ncbi:MAG: hypothetical protein QXS26_03195, partial [Thermosphaera sp.]
RNDHLLAYPEDRVGLRLVFPRSLEEACQLFDKLPPLFKAQSRPRCCRKRLLWQGDPPSGGWADASLSAQYAAVYVD